MLQDLDHFMLKMFSIKGVEGACTANIDRET